MLEDYFAGVTESLILLPKKQGKSTLMAAVSLFHLVTTPDAECVVVASSRDQATILYDQAKGLVARSEYLQRHVLVRKGSREMRGITSGGRIRVLAADADTADGVIPTLAIVDELHRHKSGALYGVLRDGLGPRDGRMVTITTAGDDEDSVLGTMRSRAYRWLVRRDGAYRYCLSNDGSFAMHEWALDADEDRENMATVKLANPAPWFSTQNLQRRHDSPSTTPWQWARFACGVWLRGEDAAIDAMEWDRLASSAGVIPEGSPVWVGWDNAFKGPDTTAVIPVWWQSRERRVIGPPAGESGRADVLTPPGSGGMLDDRLIVGAFEWLKGRYRIVGVVFDPNAGAAALAQQMERDLGLRLVEHSQKDSPMALADSRFGEAVRRGELAHDGNRTLRTHVLNAVEKPVLGDRFRYARRARGPRQPIDCLTAASMAHSVAFAESTTNPGEVFFF